MEHTCELCNRTYLGTDFCCDLTDMHRVADEMADNFTQGGYYENR